MKSSTLAILIAAAALATGCANPTRSRNLADPSVTATTLAQQVCSNCHGLTGNSISPNFPNLAAQMEGYLVAQLNGFKSHNRRDPPGFEYMWGISRSLTDDQIQGLAAYFAAQKLQRAPIEGAASQIEAGKAIASVESVRRQEELKQKFPPDKRLAYRIVEVPEIRRARPD